MKNNGPGQTSRREFIQAIGYGVAVSALAGSAWAQSREVPAIVSPDWLSKNLGDPKLIIVDIRNTEQYRKGHIPGAVNVPMNLWAVTNAGISLELPADDTLRKTLGNSGIGPTSHVVVVNRIDTDFSRADATRVAWTCILAGIPNASVLDGGYNRWLREIKTISTEVSNPSPQRFDGNMNRRLVMTKAEVVGRIGKSIIVDARTPEDYFGITAKPGHIKSAVNLPTPWIFTETGIFRKLEDLQEMASGVIGANKSREVILYCGVGGYASTWWFVLTQLFGYRNVRVYDGSMEEWVKDPSAPVSTFSWH